LKDENLTGKPKVFAITSRLCLSLFIKKLTSCIIASFSGYFYV